MVTITTSIGTIALELYEDKAPITVKNFLEYVDTGYYTNTVFHRVVKGSLIQGGGYGVDMKKKQAKGPIKNEATNGLKNEPMTISMARKEGIDSADSGFFINLDHNDWLDHVGPEAFGFCVFGKVIGGMDVVCLINQMDAATVTVLSITRSHVRSKAESPN